MCEITSDDTDEGTTSANDRALKSRSITPA
jgi:hypothetical protein